MFNRVDFPEPFKPTTPIASPAKTSKETPFRAQKSLSVLLEKLKIFYIFSERVFINSKRLVIFLTLLFMFSVLINSFLKT